MEIALILLREVGIMLMLVGLGAFMKKTDMLNEETARKLSNILISIVMPALIISLLQREKKPDQMTGFWAAMCLCAFMLGLSAVIATFVFRKRGESRDYKVERLAAALPNCGFMGIPLLIATTGEDSLIYCAVMMVNFQLSMWLWATPMLEGGKPAVKRMLLNPGVISSVLGVLLFVLGIRLPDMITSFMGHIMGLNTPLSMIMIGAFLADVRLRDAFCSMSVYKTVFWRNLVIPFVTVIVIMVFGLDAHFGRMFSLSIVIMMSCSSGSTAVLLPLRTGENTSYASQLVTVSTLLSVITLPFVAFIAQKML